MTTREVAHAALCEYYVLHYSKAIICINCDINMAMEYKKVARGVAAERNNQYLADLCRERVKMFFQLSCLRRGVIPIETRKKIEGARIPIIKNAVKQ